MTKESNEIVYTSEAGNQFTKEDIYAEIYVFIKSSERPWLDNYPTYIIRDTLYEYLMGLLDWQHPYTLLSEIDDEETKVILEKIERKLIPEPTPKRSIIIKIEGGLVQAVYMNRDIAAGFDVMIMDLDYSEYCTDEEAVAEEAHNEELQQLAQNMTNIIY